MKTKKLLILLLVFSLTALMMTACGAGSTAGDSYAAMGDVPQAENGLQDSTANASKSSLPENHKLIKTVYLEAETEDMDTLLSQLDQQVNTLGGYMEERSVHNGSAYSSYHYRNANLIIRIPADKADAFINDVVDYSNIISSNQTVEDVTLSYVATESRLEALQTEESRLLELMESAETMSDLLEIEARLTEVRYELESTTSQLRLYDNRIDYATIHLDISQVQEFTEPEPETFWERISTGFMASLKGLGNFFVELVIFLIIALPYLALIGGITLVIILLITRKKKTKTANKKKPPFPTQPPQQPTDL